MPPTPLPPHDSSSPPIPRAPPCRVNPPQLHPGLEDCLDGVCHSSSNPSSPLPQEPKGWDDWETSHQEIHLQTATERGNLQPDEDEGLDRQARLLQLRLHDGHQPATFHSRNAAAPSLPLFTLRLLSHTRHHHHTCNHTPTPLTGCIKMLQPCRNSSLEFIRMSGSR